MDPLPYGSGSYSADAVFGVLYAEDFDSNESAPVVTAPEPEPEPPEPSFTLDDVAAAQAEARAGGRTEAEHGLAASRARMLELIATGLADASKAATAVAEQRADAIARLMLAAMAACLPALCSRHGATELRALVQAVLPDLTEEPRITVRVHPQMASAMAAEIAALDAEFAERITLLPTDAIAPGDARVTWQDGQAIRDAGQARRTLQDALAALGLLELETTHA